MKTRADPAPAFEENDLDVNPAGSPTSSKDEEKQQLGNRDPSLHLLGWFQSQWALILQMAKARMKTNKAPTSPNSKVGPTIEEENMTQEEKDVVCLKLFKLAKNWPQNPWPYRDHHSTLYLAVYLERHTIVIPKIQPWLYYAV
jgi:hypothetical protein